LNEDTSVASTFRHRPTDRLTDREEERIAWAAFAAERQRLAHVSDDAPF